MASSLAQTLVLQGHVLYALILRDIGGRFGLTYFGYTWALVNPMTGILVLYGVFTVAHRLAPPDIPLLMFVVTGYLTWTHFTSCYDRTQGAVEGSKALLHFPHVTGLDVVISRTVLEILTYTGVLALFTLIGALLEGDVMPAAPKRALMAFWCAGLMGAAIGTVVGAFTPVMRSLNHVISPFIRLGFFTSGILFTGADLPSWVLPYLSWNPMFHVIEMVRELWFLSYVSPVTDYRYVALVIIGGSFAALLGERAARRWMGR